MSKTRNASLYKGSVILQRTCWILYIILASVQGSFAKSGEPAIPVERSINLGFSQDAFVAMDLGYSQNPGILKQSDLQVYARISVPIVLSIKDKSLDSWRFTLGINSGWQGVGRLGLITDVRCYVMHHKQVLGTFVPLGMKLTLTPAYKCPKGYLGFQFRWDQNLITHIAHSDYVKNTFTSITLSDNQLLDMHPEDGWYRSSGSHLGFGIEGGRTFGERSLVVVDLGILKFKSPYTGMLDAMSIGQVPLYLDMRLHYKI
jgi:hypothetical protein